MGYVYILAVIILPILGLAWICHQKRKTKFDFEAETELLSEFLKSPKDQNRRSIRDFQKWKIEHH